MIREGGVKKSVIIIGIGIINLLHAGLHIIQFIQSLILVKESISSHKHDDGFIDSILHNPIFAFIWALIGLATLWMGIKDFRYHRKCNHNESV
jgi:hypothetical protein